MCPRWPSIPWPFHPNQQTFYIPETRIYKVFKIMSCFINNNFFSLSCHGLLCNGFYCALCILQYLVKTFLILSFTGTRIFKKSISDIIIKSGKSDQQFANPVVDDLIIMGINVIHQFLQRLFLFIRTIAVTVYFPVQWVEKSFSFYRTEKQRLYKPAGTYPVPYCMCFNIHDFHRFL